MSIYQEEEEKKEPRRDTRTQIDSARSTKDISGKYVDSIQEVSTLMQHSMLLTKHLQAKIKEAEVIGENVTSKPEAEPSKEEDTIKLHI